VVEHLPSKYEALSSNTSAAKKIIIVTIPVPCSSSFLLFSYLGSHALKTRYSSAYMGKIRK
jgi:hypothetical protein